MVWIRLFIMLSLSFLLMGIGRYHKNRIIIYIGSALMLLVVIVFFVIIVKNHLIM
ncbi:succinate-acetate transporter protein [Clostridium beijerinckii]|nr:succinate-acetate transporter protein [Clostridium beijerinckii]